MLYNKIEGDLVIPKPIFHYYNTDLLLEITSKVHKVIQKYTIHTNSPPNGSHKILGYQNWIVSQGTGSEADDFLPWSFSHFSSSVNVS